MPIDASYAICYTNIIKGEYPNKQAGGREEKKMMELKVTTYCINKGQPGQYFGLKNANTGDVLYYAPNHWKTEKGAMRWAVKNGYNFVPHLTMAD